MKLLKWIGKNIQEILLVCFAIAVIGTFVLPLIVYIGRCFWELALTAPVNMNL